MNSFSSSLVICCIEKAIPHLWLIARSLLNDLFLTVQIQRKVGCDCTVSQQENPRFKTPELFCPCFLQLMQRWHKQLSRLCTHKLNYEKIKLRFFLGHLIYVLRHFLYNMTFPIIVDIYICHKFTHFHGQTWQVMDIG